MKQSHIPDVLKTGCFSECKLNKILGLDETDGISYAIQYSCKRMHDLQLYMDNHAAELQQEHINRYKDQFVAFRTLMREEESFKA